MHIFTNAQWHWCTIICSFSSHFVIICFIIFDACVIECIMYLKTIRLYLQWIAWLFFFGRQGIWPCYMLCMYALWICLQDMNTCGLWSNSTIQASLLLSLLLSKSWFISYNDEQTLIAWCLTLYRWLKCPMEKGVEKVARPPLQFG